MVINPPSITFNVSVYRSPSEKPFRLSWFFPPPLRPVPCVPSGLVAERTCGESSVEVTWTASRGAQRYAVTAASAGGHRAECANGDPSGTACTLQELMCGQTYNVTMVAINDDCTTVESAAVSLHTGTHTSYLHFILYIHVINQWFSTLFSCQSPLMFVCIWSHAQTARDLSSQSQKTK